MKNSYEQFSVNVPENQLPKDHQYYEKLNECFSNSTGTNVDKLRGFTRFVPIPEINRFLAKDKIFQKIIPIHGSIIECGVFNGAGLMTWGLLSSIYEPLNHIRKIYGFDTFCGFPNTTIQDNSKNKNVKTGGVCGTSKVELEESIEIYNTFRPLGHIPKIELIEGDALRTIPEFLNNNKHIIVSLLYLDFDLYEPTKCALENFLPRMPKGSIIVFDQLNQKRWYGETLALLDTLGIKNVQLNRFVSQPQISYAIL